MLFTGSIVPSASRRFLIYSEADFEVFHPAGATRRCADGGEIWHEGPLLRTKFHPIGATTRVYRTPKTEIFTQLSLARFSQNLQSLLLKFGWICSRGYGVMGVII